MSSPALPVLSPFSPEAFGGGIVARGGTTLVNVASAAWASANLMIGYPVHLNRPERVTKLWIYNGATATGNLDVGIYDAHGTLLVSSGSTVQAGTTTIQSLDIADTPLGPGDFYMALAMDGTSGTTRWVTWSVAMSQGYVLGQVRKLTAFPLPATMAFSGGFDNLPIFGALVWPRTVM
jgi:hypothetical protein